MACYLAIDLGGTKTSVSLGDETGLLIVSRRMPTNASADPELWRIRLRDLMYQVLDEARCDRSDIAGVGLAVPGPMNVAAGLVLEPPNMPAWRNIPVKQWVEEITRRPVTINNDANAAALAEYRFGAFRGTPDLVYLTMSTGIGAGVISGGHLLQGADDLAGEVGHMVIDRNGLPCPCGQNGCWEMYCGGFNVARRIQETLRRETRSTLLVEEAGGDLRRIDFACIERAVRRHDRYALEIWDDFLHHLAHGIGIVTMCYNPRVVVLGTIAIHMQDLIWPKLDGLVRQFAWKQACRHLVVRPTQLGSTIGDLGALALALPGGSGR
jgi:glucokinase